MEVLECIFGVAPELTRPHPPKLTVSLMFMDSRIKVSYGLIGTSSFDVSLCPFASKRKGANKALSIMNAIEQQRRTMHDDEDHRLN